MMMMMMMMYKQVIHHPDQQMVWTAEETMEKKMEKFHINLGGSLSVDMNTAAVKGAGSFNYLTEERVRF